MSRKHKTSKVIFVIASFFIFFHSYSNIETKAEDSKSYPEVEEICIVMDRLFHALKNGEIDTLKRLLKADIFGVNFFWGELFDKNRKLLDQNAGYPSFLRKYYKNAEFCVTEISTDEEFSMVNFSITFPDRREQNYQVQIVKILGNWFFNKEVHDNVQKERSEWD